jgi:spore coat polysaccharide biosynthesis protein SpsF (cytidylyltransferase family)
MARKIICIIQARFNSIRLPGKVLLDLEGKTVLERVVERVSKSRFINDIIVATTTRKEDLKIVKLCSAKRIRVYCGSENDVLDRYFQVARLLKTTDIVRITADCPLIDPKIIDKIIQTHLTSKADYTSNTLKATFPDGQDVEIFTFRALKKAWEKARLSSEREHVTPFIKNNPRLFKLLNVEYAHDLSLKRWTLDENTDYKFIKLIYRYFSKKNKVFGMIEILQLIDLHPELEKINSHVERNEGYRRSLERDKILTLHSCR